VIDDLERVKGSSKPQARANFEISLSISIANHINPYGQLSKPYLKAVPRTVDHGPGLLIVFGNQVWVPDEGVGAVAARSAVRGPLMGWPNKRSLENLF